VDVIAERDGQKLRSYLVDTFNDMNFINKKCRLTIKLHQYEKPFAISNDGTAKRVSLIYVAAVTLQDRDGGNGGSRGNNGGGNSSGGGGNNIIMKKDISVSTSYNIAHSHGEVTLSLYGRHNDALIKELCHRIVENVRMALANEN
jgi:hypothetical protein